MSWADLVRRQAGTPAALLIVEGCNKCFAAGPLSFSTLNSEANNLDLDNGPIAIYPEQINCLDPGSVQWSYDVDMREGQPRMAACTFKLVDVDPHSRELTHHALTQLMLGSARANTVPLSGTIEKASTIYDDDAFPVEDTVWWLDQEAMYVYADSLSIPSDVGPVSIDITRLVRGVYHSRDVTHEFRARDPDVIGDYGLEPDWYSIYPHWSGRRVRLYLASVQAGNVLSSPTLVWRGKIKSNPRLLGDGLTWELPCEQLWDAQDCTILNRQPVTTVSGLVLSHDATVDWTWESDAVFADRVNDTFTIPAQSWPDLPSFVETFNNLLEASVASNDPPIDDRYRFEVREDGRIQWSRVPGAPAGEGEILIWVTDDWLTAVFGRESIRIGSQLNAEGHSEEAFEVVQTITRGLAEAETTDLQVERADDFEVISIEDDGVLIRTVVLIGTDLYVLQFVDAGAGTLTLSWYGSTEYNADILLPIRVAPGDRLEVRQGLLLTGSFIQIWKTFLQHADVPERWRVGLDSLDFDWAEIEQFDAGGAATERVHVLLEPTSFRDLLLKDLRFAGLVPGISSATASLSVRPLLPPTEGASSGTLDADDDQFKALPQVSMSEDQVVATLQVNVKGPAYGGVSGVQEWPPIISEDGELLQRFGAQRKIEMEVTGVKGPDFDRAALIAHVAALFSSYAQVFSGESIVGSVPCGIRPALLLPMDQLDWTHPAVPDGLTGRRGVAELPIVVTGISVRPFAEPDAWKTEVRLYAAVDSVRRGGWAPFAEVTDYVDNGAGAGDQRYELVLSVGQYGDRNEGLDFLAGMKVYLLEWDDDVSPGAYALTISPAAHNPAGTSVYLTSAPGSDPGAGGEWRLSLNLYTTASQTDAAKEYVHVADEDDGLIGGSGDRGFRPI